MDISGKLVSELITSSKVVTCSPQDNIKFVIELLNKENVGSICIVENKKLVGIFTERDFFKKIGANACEKIFVDQVSNYMTEDPKTVKETSNLRQSFGLMRIGNFRHLIVVNSNHLPLRVISIRDIFNYFCGNI